MFRILITLVLVALGSFLAFRESSAGSSLFWVYAAAPYLPLLALALHKFWNEGTLVQFLKPRAGDISLGVLSAAFILSASWGFRALLAPAGTPRHAWYFRIYLQLGDPEILQHSVLLTALVLGLGLVEEIVWRGMVLSEITDRLGRRAWPLAALLYALALLPTAFTLRDPIAGPNPLLLFAALGAGLVWSFVAEQTKRIGPVAISHMAFIYFSIVQFRWPGT